MKTLFLSTLIGITALTGVRAQSEVAAEIYDQYADADDVLSMSLNYDLIDILDLDLDINDKMRHISGDVYQVKFIAFGEESRPGSTLGAIDRKLASSSLVEIKVPEDMDDGDYRMLKFYGVNQGSYYSDICMLMLSDDSETGIFIAVYGKIKIRKES